MSIRNLGRWLGPGALIVASALGACTRSATEDTFTAGVAARMRAALPGATVTITEPRVLEIRYADGSKATQRLDNLWLQCQNNPDSCDSSTERVVRVMAERQGTRAPSRESVLATVKDRDWLDEVEKSGAVPPIARPFAGVLWKVYVVDLPDATRMLTPDDVQALKLGDEELDALALANLARLAADFHHEPVEAGSPVRSLHVGDSYESARLLLHDRWQELAAEVHGDLLACAPSRDYVYFVGSGESPETVATFRRRMKDISQTEAHSLVPQVLRWTPEGWVVDE